MKRIASWLRRFAEWLDPQPVPEPLVPLDLLTSARHAVLEAGKTRHTGAFKAVLALKALRVLHPGIRQRDLRLAIELAVREVL
jgi:hypothetical protein